MKTKERILNTARALFNKHGFKNVTLRAVAQELSISYGNVTYHFKTKCQLISSLYEDMLLETSEILKSINYNNLFKGILEAPKISFSISMKYSFFYVDFVEIKRSYNDIALKVDQDNRNRKGKYLLVLQQLQVQDVLRKDLTDKDLYYLMDLSGAIRTFFFINLNPNNFYDVDLEDRYVEYVNHLIFPYLTKMGVERYKSYSKK